MEKYLEKASTSKQKETVRQRSMRKYKEDYIQYGFIASAPEDHQQPFCLICNTASSNDSLIPSKLIKHLKINHPTLKETL